eukprot:1107505-Prymnesium_polylepis.2
MKAGLMSTRERRNTALHLRTDCSLGARMTHCPGTTRRCDPPTRESVSLTIGTAWCVLGGGMARLEHRGDVQASSNTGHSTTRRCDPPTRESASLVVVSRGYSTPYLPYPDPYVREEK